MDAHYREWLRDTTYHLTSGMRQVQAYLKTSSGERVTEMKKAAEAAERAAGITEDTIVSTKKWGHCRVRDLVVPQANQGIDVPAHESPAPARLSPYARRGTWNEGKKRRGESKGHPHPGPEPILEIGQL